MHITITINGKEYWYKSLDYAVSIAESTSNSDYALAARELLTFVSNV